MESDNRNVEIESAIETIDRYFSDSIAPLQAASAFTILMSEPGQRVASRIQKWAADAFNAWNADLLFSDLLFIAVKRLRVFSVYGLVSKDSLDRYLGELKPHVLELSPVEERNRLAESLASLGQEIGLGPSRVGGAAVSMERKPGKPGGSGRTPFFRRSRSVSLLLERTTNNLKAGQSAESDAEDFALPQLVGATILGARDSEELEHSKQVFDLLGVPFRSENILKLMAGSVPGWNLPLCPDPSGKVSTAPTNSMLEAMKRIIQLAGTKEETTRRWQDLVGVGIDQMKQGSLARAVVMMDLAENIAQLGGIDPAALSQARQEAQRALDLETLRPFVQNSQNHSHLRRIMTFFDGLSPGSLLQQLDGEPKRSRRRLLLDLLEIQGLAARSEALRWLQDIVETDQDNYHWFLPRNLIYLLHRISPSENLPGDSEIGLLELILEPAKPPTLIREVITYFGHYKLDRSESALAAFMKKVEAVLTGPGARGEASEEAKSLLDRTANALARHGTAGAIRAVRVHSLKSDARLGDTIARLDYLSSQDLSCDQQSIAEIVDRARQSLPRKMMGVTLRKESSELLHLVTALSSTSTPRILSLMKDVASRLADQESGRVANKYLRGIEIGESGQEQGARRLTGDLELFGLPDLLLQLERTQAQGRLTLSDKGGATAGTMDFEGGKITSCHSGGLLGEAAVYKLFEKPISGTFAFQRRPSEENKAAESKAIIGPAAELVVEGARRYDEFQWLRAVVPDGAILSPAGPEPDCASVGEDPNVCRLLWQSMTNGLSPAECELRINAEPIQLRRLLVRWLEDNLVKEQPPKP